VVGFVLCCLLCCVNVGFSYAVCCIGFRCHNPTHKDHKTIHKTLIKCDKIIDKKLIKYLTQKNPSPPTLNALLKLHKPNTPIRPMVNNRMAPAYKAAKKLNTILSNHLHLENQHNVINSNTLAKDLI